MTKVGKAQIVFSDFVFANLPTLIYILFGVTMSMIWKEWNVVSHASSIFRFCAWVVVLIGALAERTHIKDRSKLNRLEIEFGKALDTIGIRREEFDELSRRVLLLEKYVAKT